MDEYEINKVLDSLDTSKPSGYPRMTYEQGVEEALMWIVGDIPNEEFAAYPVCDFNHY